MTDINTDVYTKPDKDPNALKIASFRTKEGVWAEFCSKAESIGLTATDVLKAAMEQFINGEYQPTVGTSAQHHDNVLTRNDVLEIVNTAISTLSIPTDESIHTLVITHINTTVTRLTELETSTHSQLVEFKEQLKKLEDRSAVTTEPIANPSPTTPPKQTSSGKYPVGVTEDNRAYYNKLAGNPELLKAVTELLDSDAPNTDIPSLLANAGMAKGDGSAYEKSRLSHIRAAVKILNGAEANDN